MDVKVLQWRLVEGKLVFSRMGRGICCWDPKQFSGSVLWLVIKMQASTGIVDQSFPKAHNLKPT